MTNISFVLFFFLFFSCFFLFFLVFFCFFVFLFFFLSVFSLLLRFNPNAVKDFRKRLLFSIPDKDLAPAVMKLIKK